MQINTNLINLAILLYAAKKSQATRRLFSTTKAQLIKLLYRYFYYI